MRKRIILVTVAVLLAVLGTFAVYSYGKNADQRAMENTKSTAVLVVTKRVAAGTTWADAVKNNYFRQEHFPENSVPSSALTQVKNASIAADDVALADIAPGQFVLNEAFGVKTAETGALQIPKGMVALSVQMPINAYVAGYVGPGAEVTIFVTAKMASSSTDKQTPDTAGDELDVTKVVLTRVSVLAVSQAPVTALDGGSDGGSSSSGSPLVTLALTQREAERVILSQKVGELYLALLSPSSVVSSDDPGVNNLAHLKPVPVFVK